MTALRALALAAVLGLPAAAVAQTACPAIPPRTPAPRGAAPEYLDNPAWRARVTQLNQAVSGDMSRMQLVFLGDSLTQGWFPTLFDQFYAHRSALNLGVAGDFTQGLLWRIQNGNWPPSLRPKVAVVLIGTNNALFNPPEDTALGVAEIVRAIRQRSPGTRVLLVGLLPRGADGNDPHRQANIRVNALIARCADERTVFWADPGSAMVDGQGRLSTDVAQDRLHLTMVGYAMLGAGLEPYLHRLLAN